MIGNLKRFVGGKFLLIGLVVVALGLVVDLAFVGPRSKKLSSLEKRRNELVGQAAMAMNSSRDNQRFLDYMNSKDLRLGHQNIEDPTTFLGKLIEETNLVRLELRTIDEIESANLVQSKFFLRVHGPFDSTLKLVQALEQGARLVTIDEIKISRGNDDSRLETRLNLSIYDPLEKL